MSKPAHHTPQEKGSRALQVTNFTLSILAFRILRKAVFLTHIHKKSPDLIAGKQLPLRCLIETNARPVRRGGVGRKKDSSLARRLPASQWWRPRRLRRPASNCPFKFQFWGKNRQTWRRNSPDSSQVPQSPLCGKAGE
jgi:hypothetical protein